MPVYRAIIEKYASFNAEYWVNRYFVNAASLEDASLALNGIVDAEKALYWNNIVITKTHVDDGVPNTDVFITVMKNTQGTRSASTGDLMPLFVCGRVDLNPTGGGRPSRKYLRAVFYEGDVNFMAVDAGRVAALQTYANNIVASGVCDPQGNDIISASASPVVAMRQLRRGSKKKVTP